MINPDISRNIKQAMSINLALIEAINHPDDENRDESLTIIYRLLSRASNLLKDNESDSVTERQRKEQDILFDAYIAARKIKHTASLLLDNHFSEKDEDRPESSLAAIVVDYSCELCELLKETE